MSYILFQVIRRELLIAFRNPAELLNPLWFFILAIMLFPLSLGSEPQLLERIAPGIIWVAALLSMQLSLERIFHDDFYDGSLEQLMLTPTPFVVIVFGKMVAHWLLTGLPLILISPILAILLSMDPSTWWITIKTLLLGTPILSFIGAIGVALTIGLGKGGVLLSLLTLPLYIPVLIFATSSINAQSMGLDYSGQLAILAAMLVTCITLAPLAVTASLRISIH